MKPIPVKKRITEASVEAYLRVAVTTRGGICSKWSSPNTRGVLDRVAVFPGGVVWFVEVKSPRGKLSKLQDNMIKTLRRLEANVHVVWSKKDVDDWLTEIGY